MNAAQIFIFFLRRPSVSFSMSFSDGTRLLVNVDQQGEEEGEHEEQGGSGPSVQVLVSQDPGSPHLLVCLLSGFDSPVQDVLWWVNDTAVTSSQVSWTRSEEGGAYSTTSVFEVSPADWRSRSTFWCGAVQEDHVYRQRVCSGDGL
uniref:Ig-like domain-containing protein n=1 Tax=Larimichthys crocea TaxID=215358 RepID=A0A0F8AVP9_LARCR